MSGSAAFEGYISGSIMTVTSVTEGTINVGDSVLGHGVNLEAGSIVANYRNEREDKDVQVRINGQLQRTGCDKFGALLGDQCRIGANAVLAPGAVLAPASVVGRGQVFDAEACV